MMLKKLGVGFGLLIGSYLMAGLVNASPITQPKLSGPSSRAPIVVVAPEYVGEAPATSEVPATDISPLPDADTHPLQSL